MSMLDSSFSSHDVRSHSLHGPLMKAADDLVLPNIQAHLVPATLRGHRQLHWIGGETLMGSVLPSAGKGDLVSCHDKPRLIGSCEKDPFQVGISRGVLKFPFGVPDVVSLDL